MAYQISDYVPTADEWVWLRAAYDLEKSGTGLSYRRLRAATLGKVSAAFDPAQINRHLFSGKRLTLFGLALVDPEADSLVQIDRLIQEIRSGLLRDPEEKAVDLRRLSETLRVDMKTLSRLFDYLSDIGPFWSSATSAGAEGGYLTILVDNDACFEQYFRYEGLQASLDGIARSVRRLDQPTLYMPAGTLIAPITYPIVSNVSYEANTCFVMMAMTRDKPELEDVYNAIKESCRLFGISATRVDDIQHSGIITDMILERMRASEFLIADLTGERPNVYYEVGFAHAISRRPVLVRKAGTPLHFDLSVHNVPEYRNITELREILMKRLESMTGRKPGNQ